ncbi:MAG TPA: hypothetical protein VFK54_06485 [Candidatus Limnocylindrales bacterium]|nr:hypothetical protein [Candidatus Limnocylindrales bacterium]
MLPLVIIASACGASLPFGPSGGIARGEWVWPTPAPLPPGAVPVPLETLPVPDSVEPGVSYDACPAALVGDFTIAAGRDGAAPIRYSLVDSGNDIRVIWPAGFSARRMPLIQIVAPDGTVVAREGEVVSGLGGGQFGAEGQDAFAVCLPAWLPMRRGAAAP